MAVIKELVESIPEGRRDIHNWVRKIPAEDREDVRAELMYFIKQWWPKQDTTKNEDFLCDQATRALGWMDVTRRRRAERR